MFLPIGWGGLSTGKSIAGDSALRLQRYLGVEARFWMDLQTEYDLPMIKEKSGFTRRMAKRFSTKDSKITHRKVLKWLLMLSNGLQHTDNSALMPQL